MLETKCFTVREDACLIEAKPSACDLLPKAATSAAAVLAGEEGFEPSNAGIKIRCLNQLGDSPPVQLKSTLSYQPVLEHLPHTQGWQAA